MTISEFSIKRPVTTMMIVISMVAIGVMTLVNLKAERLPKFNIPVATIVTTWSGASPEDMEKLVTEEIEDALTSVEGITKVKTESNIGSSVVVVEFNYGEDVDKKVSDLITEISRIRGSLPDDVNEPRVRKASASGDMVMMISITGDDLVETKSFAENIVKPRFEKITGMGEINIRGGFEKEILVEIDPDKLEGYGMSIGEVYSLIKNSSMNFPAGNIREGDKEFLVRVIGEVKTLEDIKTIVVKNDGTQILYLTDIADVRISLKDKNGYGRTNGKDNVIMWIQKSDTGNIIDISENVKKEMKNLEPQLPDGSSFEINVDSSKDIVNSIGSVKNNALTGLVLASVILFIFLKDLRATIVIAISIPVSVIATFSLFGIKDITLNVISLMGLSLGVGMLVDNSVVVLDNIFRHLTEYKKPRMEAAKDGASEMVVPIIASTATTVAVFLPIVIREGLAKEIFHDLSYAIAFSLLASLVIAITFVPMVCSRILKSDRKLNTDGKILNAVRNMYIKILKKALKFRIITVILTIVSFVVIMGIGIKNVGGGFFPKTDDGVYTIVGDLPNGLNVDKANRIAMVLEKAAAEHPATKVYSTSVSSDSVSVVVNIGTPNERNVDKSVFEIVSEIRKNLDGKVTDARLIVVPSFSRGGGGGDLNLVLQSDDVLQLENYSKTIQQKMTKMSGITDITNSLLGGNPETRLVLNRQRLEYYGINVRDLTLDVSYQIRGGTPITIKTGNEELDVTVQLGKEYRESIEKMMDARIATNTGGTVKLRDVAALEIMEGPIGIEKEDRIRIVELGANLTKGNDLVTAQKQIEEIVAELDLPSSISYSFGGEGKDLEKVVGQLVFAFMVAIFLIYFILAAQFESYILPLIVMGSVPLSVMGVYVGLMITRQKTDVMVFVGIIMLAGIVVNNAIVLIDYINLLRARGHEVYEAIVTAGRTRLRPIIITTMTTVFGMIPLALGLGQGSEMYKGMAIAVIFGLTFSTILTLVFIPVLYSLYTSVLRKIRREK